MGKTRTEDLFPQEERFDGATTRIRLRTLLGEERQRVHEHAGGRNQNREYEQR